MTNTCCTRRSSAPGLWRSCEDAALQEYRERIEGYMIKAAREAKARTSWANRQCGLRGGAAAVHPRGTGATRGQSLPCGPHGIPASHQSLRALNALSQTLCKLTAPGVPDIYQGNEIWDFSLVDPDNRRPVDYARRSALLGELQQGDVGPAEARALVENLHDGRAKLLLIWKALNIAPRRKLCFAMASICRCAPGASERRMCAPLRASAATSWR